MLVVAVASLGAVALPAALRSPGAARAARAPMACAATPPPEAPVVLREAKGWADDWAASKLLHDCFGGSSLYFYSSLRAPGLNANVFFRPLEPPIVVVASRADEEEGQLVGVAQLMRVELKPESGPGAGSTAAFVQNVAGERSRDVAPASPAATARAPCAVCARAQPTDASLPLPRSRTCSPSARRRTRSRTVVRGARCRMGRRSSHTRDVARARNRK